MAWTTPQDIINRWPTKSSTPPEPDDVKLGIFIQEAEDAIEFQYPKIQDRIDSLELPLLRVVKVVSRVVIRAYEGAYSPLQSYQNSTGPFSQGGTFESGSKKHVALTEEDIADLAPSKNTYQYGTTDMAPNMRVSEPEEITIRHWPSGWLGRR